MDLQLAEQQVKKWAEANSYSLGLNGSKIEAKYIWNPGGFVNQSYRISDGETIRHVKIAPEQRAPHLKQWAVISEHLTNNYKAPRLIEEVTEEIIPGFSYGLVFDFIEGNPLSSISNPIPVIEKVLKALNQLHTDNEIKTVIASETKGKGEDHSYSEAFIEEYITRFEEDLQVIRSEKHLLNFVSEDSLDWFDSEVETLRQIASKNPSFQKKATDVVHNDLNWQNLLVNENQDFWIIDWDDLAVSGDAAMDYSVLLWPLYNSKDWPFWKDQVIGLAGNEILERIEFYFRAKLLDDVIDVLADYVEAENIPDVKEMTQKRAKEIHLRAYPEYLRLYAR
ncbi:aminoglycoside phosphotransferase family protein [Paenibacillus sp. N3/727]|uniref:phosphotransferase n=1 Tax=Paenibacillus sp. N3/727 TaxID=2925845 RepID=UPI001F533141|nr:phosphotransferase [Paenibacillus sp. N3/727]UNK19792.1 aminoglycoside phosphotransferase family protein [Paenibacillus sp. N3/727]